MSEADAFPDLISRLRGGDARAAEELFRRYEAQVRLEVQLRLRDPRLRRLLDVVDVCQSVMFSFFVRARLGDYDIAGPRELARLLAAMARNKVAAVARRHGAARRDFRRAEALGGADVAALGPSPDSAVANQELLREVRARLSEEEQRIAELRSAGRNWAEVAEALGGTADGRRMQLARAAGRVLRELGLEAEDE
jgi:RNA polymerase sigma-70 factor (ECF subfamily)